MLWTVPVTKKKKKHFLSWSTSLSTEVQRPYSHAHRVPLIPGTHEGLMNQPYTTDTVETHEGSLSGLLNHRCGEFRSLRLGVFACEPWCCVCLLTSQDLTSARGLQFSIKQSNSQIRCIDAFYIHANHSIMSSLLTFQHNTVKLLLVCVCLYSTKDKMANAVIMLRKSSYDWIFVVLICWPL